MNLERWQKIEKLYHSAREHGVAVLEGTDPDLRREVERLLEQESTGKILDRSAGHLLDELTVTQPMDHALLSMSGRRIGQYEIRDMLGAGGMGVVYLAFDSKLERTVALKFLPSHLRHDEELKRRLLSEARAASALDHPNIVVIYEIHDADDFFIAMAYHEGDTLRERIAQGLTQNEALRIARQMAAGLAKAHENGILHRDIKPGNVIVAKDGITRIIDFGLATSTEVTATLDGGIRGTPLYMSPEQASGKALDARTDLWSLGAVLYEMLAGHPPFRGGTPWGVIHAVRESDPVPIPHVHPQVAAIVQRALEKDPAKRYQTAVEMGADLDAALAPAPVRSRWLIPAAALLLVVVGILGWFYQRSEKRLWAREKAIPEMERLKSAGKPLAAWQIWQQAAAILPGDSQLAQLREALTHLATIRSTPAGAQVEIKDYLSPNDVWVPLGTTPLVNARIPSGYLRWRVSKDGTELVGAPEFEGIEGYKKEFHFALDAAARAPKEMVAVPGGDAFAMVWSIGDVGPYKLPPFTIDRFEVTNQQYQEFVDRGGYQKREYWKEKFVRDGRELTFDQALDLLRDSTGRPGPSTWAAGHYPAGQANYPVGGVSWYEASAYAEFAGKSLPVISQWYLAAPSSVAKYITPLSNFSSAPAPVGQYQGLGSWGTYDMAGSMSEWTRTEAGHGTRYLLGGGLDTPPVEYFEPFASLPFLRTANSGFRCVRNGGPIPAEAAAEKLTKIRDFAHTQPASDAVFKLYRDMYSYARTPLNVKAESVKQDSADWRKEKVTISAAYNNERLAVHLFLPKNVPPPYQTVIFFPSARVLSLPNSDELGDMKFIDYVIQSGRAVAYPVYKGTYERPDPGIGIMHTAEGRETLLHDSKDLGRSIDYLETRSDIDRERLGFLGVSMGAAMGVNLAAVEPRLKAVIFLDGGFRGRQAGRRRGPSRFRPPAEGANLAHSGKFDWIFLGKDALIRMLGAPAADKRAVLFDTAHDVSEQRADMIREVTAWLDRYLGKVR